MSNIADIKAIVSNALERAEEAHALVERASRLIEDITTAVSGVTDGTRSDSASMALRSFIEAYPKAGHAGSHLNEGQRSLRDWYSQL